MNAPEAPRPHSVRMDGHASALARLSTFASKTPAVAGVLLVGLHYTVDFAASAASPEIFGGGWAGNVSPSRSSRTDRSGFGSTERGKVTIRPSVVGMTTSTIFTARNLSMIWRGARPGACSRAMARSV